MLSVSAYVDIFREISEHRYHAVREYAYTISVFGRNINTCAARYKFKVSNFLTNSVNVNEVVRRNCCNLVSEDRKRIFEFLRELLSCMDWYGWNGECILSRDEMHVTGKDTVLVLVILREKR